MHQATILQYQKTFPSTKVTPELQTEVYTSFHILGVSAENKLKAGPPVFVALAQQWTQPGAKEVLPARQDPDIESTEPTLTEKITYILAAIGLSFSLFFVGIVLGVSIGMLAGLWSGPLAFITSLWANENAALVVAAASMSTGLSGGLVSGMSFFKTELPPQMVKEPEEHRTPTFIRMPSLEQMKASVKASSL